MYQTWPCKRCGRGDERRSTSVMRCIEVMYYRYYGPPVTAQHSGYDRFPLATNGWGTIHPVSGNGPTTPG
jgi:hypothetical protein